MPIDITMPRLSDTMEMGTVLHWHVKEGDEVSSGDVLADIETDKATMELQSFDDGIVQNILIAAGEQVSVGTAIARLLEEDEDPSDAPAPEDVAPAETPSLVEESSSPEPTQPQPSSQPSSGQEGATSTLRGAGFVSRAGCKCHRRL